MGPHRKRLRRFEERGDVRFLTFSCHRRLPLFRNDAIKDVFVEYLDIACRTPHVRLIAWVVMPEHVHLLLQPETGHLTVQTLLQNLKRIVAARVLHRWRQLDAPILKQLTNPRRGTHFWQAGGGYDRNIWSDRELHEKIDYVHNNPVARRLADLSIDWRWSSARWYAGLDYDGPPLQHTE